MLRSVLTTAVVTQFVLLGSVATDKYVGPLLDVFGDRLYFPATFAGRGDMSRGGLLLRARGEDQGAVLRADVVALTHALRGVVVLPEHPQQVGVRHLRGVEDHPDDLGVGRAAGAHLLVRRVRRDPAGVADRGRPHAWHLPERLLLAPEAAEGELRDLEAVRVGPGDGRAQDGVPSRGHDWL